MAFHIVDVSCSSVTLPNSIYFRSPTELRALYIALLLSVVHLEIMPCEATVPG